MSVTATTAPARNKHNRFTITEVRASPNGMLAVVTVSDSASNVVGAIELTMNASRWQGISFSAQNEVQVFTADTPGAPSAALALDFTAFASTAGAFAAKAAALEARLVATGRLPT